MRLTRDVHLARGLRGTITRPQITARVARVARYRLLYRYAPRSTQVASGLRGSLLTGAVPKGYESPGESAAQAILAEAGELRNNGISLLNHEPVRLEQTGIWQPAPGGDPLWAYALHYGEWALPLARACRISPDSTHREYLQSSIGSWLDANRPGSQPGWDPYPLSRRLVAWSRVSVLLRDDPSWRGFWAERLEPSMRQQAHLLSRNIEHDVPNNHLIANYRALAWVGMTFPHWPESGRLTSLGVDGLLVELERQVLSDGGHDERSVSYHTIVLQDLLETWALASSLGNPVAPSLATVLEPMSRYLAGLQAPGGSWPMLNDTVPGYPCDPAEVLVAAAVLLDKPDLATGLASTDATYAYWLNEMLGSVRSADPGIEAESLKPLRQSVSFPITGYAVVAGPNRDWAVFDAGPMGPSRVLGHGHADALSVEIHRGSTPLIVDPGVCSYSSERWRNHFRSTRAHNTAVVDGQDQCVYFGSFRVAYPPPARLLSSSSNHAEGEHSGYARLPGSVVHRRRLELVGAGVWRIDDKFFGHGRHDITVSLQFSEGAKLSVGGTGGRAEWPDGSWLDISVPSPPRGAAAHAEDSWVSPGWNLRQSAPKYCLSWQGGVPAECSIELRCGGPTADVTKGLA